MVHLGELKSLQSFGPGGRSGKALDLMRKLRSEVDVLNRAGQEQHMQKKSPKGVSKSAMVRVEERRKQGEEGEMGLYNRFHRPKGFSSYSKSQECQVRDSAAQRQCSQLCFDGNLGL